METIAELRKICQWTAKRDRSNVWMRYVSRFFSIYFTRLLLPTNITANQVSLAMILVGMFATVFFLSASPWMFLLGALLLQCWYILDNMDGEVARYRYFKKTGGAMDKPASVTGMYFDIINHYIVNLLVPAMLGMGLARQTGNLFFAALAIAASLGQVLTLAMHDASRRAVLNYLTAHTNIEVVKSPAPEESQGKDRSLVHWAFMVLHYTMTYPTVMNLVLITAILGAAWPLIPWRAGLLAYLAAGSAIVVSVIIGRTIVQGLLEQECKSKFNVSS